ncbi:hypothetical protein ACFX2I_029318 [Malus domestica]
MLQGTPFLVRMRVLESRSTNGELDPRRGNGSEARRRTEGPLPSLKSRGIQTDGVGFPFDRSLQNLPELLCIAPQAIRCTRNLLCRLPTSLVLKYRHVNGGYEVLHRKRG